MEKKKNAKTEWKGLWNNREGVYSGQVIKKSDIPDYARLIVRYNKYYDKDSNRPRFVYCFANGDAAKAITMKVDKEEYKETVNLKEKAEELAEVMREGNRNASIMRLPSESQAIMNDLIMQAISLVEEITGEEWCFSCLSYD